MCGICATVSSTLSTPEAKEFETLLYVSQLRGMDSTGVFSVDKFEKGKKFKDRVLMIKEDVPSSYFLWDKDDKKGIKKKIFSYGHRALVGHCRYATVGEPSAENAHPFVFKHVIGVHNGTIRKKFKGTADFQTDSQALYNLINEVGIEEALNEVEAIDSAYALIYYDNRNDTLNFVRNDDRPLWFWYNSSRTTLYVASEIGFLQLMSQHHNEKMATDKDDKGIERQAYWQLKKHTLFSISMTKQFDIFTNEGVKITPLKIKEYTQAYKGWSPHNSKYYSGAEYGFEGWDDLDEDLPKKKVETPPFLPDKPKETSVPVIKPADLIKKEVVSDSPHVKSHTPLFFHGFGGTQESRGIIEKKFKKGCQMCRQEIDIHEPNIDKKIGWVDNEKPICPRCMQNEWVVKNVVRYSAIKAEFVTPEQPG